MKSTWIGLGFRAFQATRADRLLAPFTRGLGAILMFHHVRPQPAAGFAPNGLLEITPDFLDAVLGALKRKGFAIVDLDTALSRLLQGQADEPFAALTFDDGYRDTAEHALPVLRRHAAPFTVYATTGFADRTARLWWCELEEAVRRMTAVPFGDDVNQIILPAETDAKKASAFQTLYRALRAGPEERLLAVIADLAQRSGVDGRQIVAENCLDFEGLARLAEEPLCTIGAHTLTHPMLAKHDAAFVRRELDESRRILEERLGRPVRHLAYPVGDPTSAGPREFALARELGYASAVTTRPGMIFPGHRDHLTALPRLSINGRWQTTGAVETLLSGAPFALWNGGRRLNVA